MLMERKKGTSHVRSSLTYTWKEGWERKGQFSSLPRGLKRRDQGTLGTWWKQHSIRWPYVNNSPRTSQNSWPASCSNLTGLQCDFQVPDGSQADPNVEPCEKRLTFQNKCVTRKKGHFQEHLATEPGAVWSPWPQGDACRSDVNRWEEQSLGQAILLMELGLQITLKTH